MIPAICNMSLLSGVTTRAEFVLRDGAGVAVDLADAEIVAHYAVAGQVPIQLVVELRDVTGGFCVTIPALSGSMYHWELSVKTNFMDTRELAARGSLYVRESVDVRDDDSPIAKLYLLDLSDKVRLIVDPVDVAYWCQLEAKRHLDDVVDASQNIEGFATAAQGAATVAQDAASTALATVSAAQASAAEAAGSAEGAYYSSQMAENYANQAQTTVDNFVPPDTAYFDSQLMDLDSQLMDLESQLMGQIMGKVNNDGHVVTNNTNFGLPQVAINNPYSAQETWMARSFIQSVPLIPTITSSLGTTGTAGAISIQSSTNQYYFNAATTCFISVFYLPVAFALLIVREGIGSGSSINKNTDGVLIRNGTAYFKKYLIGDSVLNGGTTVASLPILSSTIAFSNDGQGNETVTNFDTKMTLNGFTLTPFNGASFQWNIVRVTAGVAGRIQANIGFNHGMRIPE